MYTQSEFSCLQPSEIINSTTPITTLLSTVSKIVFQFVNKGYALLLYLIIVIYIEMYNNHQKVAFICMFLYGSLQ